MRVTAGSTVGALTTASRQQVAKSRACSERTGQDWGRTCNCAQFVGMKEVSEIGNQSATNNLPEESAGSE